MVRNFLIRLVINAIALAITANLLPGITLSQDVGTVLLIALVFGVINAIVKPILIALTCPAVLLTLGLFVIVINALLLLLTSAIVGESVFHIDGFVTALIGGVVMGVVAWVVEFVLDRLGLDEDK